MMEEIGTTERVPGVPLAWRRQPGRGPGVVFLGGFRSDMTGTKAEALAGFCAANGTPFLRLDYSGHGASGGRFEDGAIGDWADDAAFLVERLTDGPQVLVGSSMGGWIALLLARRLAERVHALVGIAPAPDFTRTLMWPEFSEAQRSALLRDGMILRPSEYGDPYPITRRLIEEGDRHLLLDAGLDIPAPVRILQGMRDPDVPWRHALRLVDAIRGEDVRLTLIKDGDHRLSRSQDLALLERCVAPLLGEDRGQAFPPARV